jgi:hypothetical protein
MFILSHLSTVSYQIAATCVVKWCRSGGITPLFLIYAVAGDEL